METHPGGRFVAKAITVRGLIQFAYAVFPPQMRGGPSWLDDRYDIETRIEGAGELSQSELMAPVAALLTDRFKLVTHSETIDQTAYELRVFDKGARIQRSAPDAPKSLKLGRGGLDAQRIPMATLAAALGQAPDIGATVVDATGLTGEFDIKLRWQPSSAAVPEAVKVDAADLSSIFKAVEEQLGLKLLPTKRPIQFLVIDHIERPADH